MNRKAQGLVPQGRPGRGITAEGLHMLVGLPRIDGVEDAESVSAGQRAFIDASKAAWQGPNRSCRPLRQARRRGTAGPW